MRHPPEQKYQAWSPEGCHQLQMWMLPHPAHVCKRWQQLPQSCIICQNSHYINAQPENRISAVVSSHSRPWLQAAQPQQFQQEVRRLQCWLAAAEDFWFCSLRSVLEVQHVLESKGIGALGEFDKRQHVVCWLRLSCWRGAACCFSAVVSSLHLPK